MTQLLNAENQALNSLNAEMFNRTPESTIFVLLESDAKAAVFEEKMKTIKTSSEKEVLKLEGGIVSISTYSPESSNFITNAINQMRNLAFLGYRGRMDIATNSILPFNPNWFDRDLKPFGILSVSPYMGGCYDDMLDSFVADCEDANDFIGECEDALNSAKNLNAEIWFDEMTQFITTNFHGVELAAVELYLKGILKICKNSLTSPTLGEVFFHTEALDIFNKFAISAGHSDREKRHNPHKLDKAFDEFMATYYAAYCRMSSPWSNQIEPDSRLISYLTDRCQVSMTESLSQMVSLKPKSASEITPVSSKFECIRKSLGHNEKFLPDLALSKESFKKSELAYHRKMLSNLTQFLLRDIRNCLGAAYASAIINELDIISKSEEAMSKIDPQSFWTEQADLLGLYSETRSNWFKSK